MDEVRNPFVPGAGTPPAKLAGRDALLEKARITLERVKQGRSAKSFIVVGLRGVGKTVLLSQIYECAAELGFEAIQIEAHENKSLPALLVPKLRQILLRLDTSEHAKELVKRGLRGLVSFAKAVKVSYQDVELSLSLDGEPGLADSGDLEIDLADLLEVIGQCARQKGSAVALIVDELQYLSEEEMSALIMALHRVAQRGLPLVLIGGGLPQLVGLAGKSKSYAERLFDYPQVGALDAGNAADAIMAPIVEEGEEISPEATAAIYEQTSGYPYFLQTWGHYAWNVAEASPITTKHVDDAAKLAIENLDESFFRVRFDRLTPSEKTYLFAMAELGPGPHRSGDIAVKLGKKVESVAPVRSSLIKKGMVFSPSHGDTAFTVPMFDAYLTRIYKGEAQLG
ncbi:MAG: ATP-binding protein [Ahrensia sp.]|nr:ATP-binding protein [Ahrensia sp.]